MTGFEVTTADSTSAHVFVSGIPGETRGSVVSITTDVDGSFGSVTSVQDGLSGCGAMAGSDPGGTQWAGAYDEFARPAAAVPKLPGVSKTAEKLAADGLLTPPAERFEQQIVVGGQIVVVRGAVVNGVIKIGTAFTP